MLIICLSTIQNIVLPYLNVNRFLVDFTNLFIYIYIYKKENFVLIICSSSVVFVLRVRTKKFQYYINGSRQRLRTNKLSDDWKLAKGKLFVLVDSINHNFFKHVHAVLRYIKLIVFFISIHL